MTSQRIARWIYDHLPAQTGANRYDREWERGRYSARFCDYIGPQPSTQDSSQIQENWKPKKAWHLRRPSPENYGKWQWRAGYAHGFVGKLCGWSLSYYDGRVEIWIRKHAPREEN